MTGTAQRYIGTKIVLLTPMSRAEYNEYRGWQLPADENGADDGYLVEDTDGGAPNDARHAGYISWSPKNAADSAYRRTEGLPVGLAVEAMKLGKRVARAGWNGAGMFAYLVPEDVTRLPDGELVYHRQYMALKTAQGDVAAWAPSGSDALADDWYILD